MKPQNLREFAEDLRRKGDIRESDLADDILMLLDLEEEVAAPYGDLCDGVAHYAPVGLETPKAVEWLGDRSNLLEEIEKLLEESDALPKTGANGLPISRDTDDAIKELLGTLKTAEAILEEHGWPGTDFLDALEKLAESAPTPMEYDL